ncbi:MAG: hypothetical protein IJS69_00440 [Selenomonadaceae bacterium]|nr:hypothetical protein [Selenomonadaceae bacterium]
MLKKFFALTFLFIIIAAPTSAMRLELVTQPVGEISGVQQKIFIITGATKIEGTGSNSQYTKGVAVFADGEYTRENPGDYAIGHGNIFPGEPIYFHFDVDKKICKLGDRNAKNSLDFDLFDDSCEIFLIGNTSGHDLYLVKVGTAIKVIGLKDGKWVELLDVNTLREKHDVGWNYSLEKFFTEDNKIIFRYKLRDDQIDLVCRLHEVNRKFYTEAIKP